VTSWISTGHLPTEAVVRQLVDEAHQRFGTVREGKVARYIPALASANPADFGIAVAWSWWPPPWPMGGAILSAASR